MTGWLVSGWILLSTVLALAYSPAASAVPMFTPRTAVCPGIQGSRDIDVLDFDNDGNTDILGGYSSIALCRNQGAGTFATTTLVSGVAVSSLKGTDIDLDGLTDIVGVNTSPLGLNWWRNNSDGTFSNYSIDTSIDATTKIYTTDIDSDGDMDILGALPSSDQVVLWRNDDAGPAVPSRMYVNGTDSGGNPALFAIDPGTETEVAAISLTAGTGDMAPSHNGRKLYVISGSDILVIDVLNNTVARTLSGLGGSQLAVSRDGTKLYSVFWGGNALGAEINVISTATDTLITTISGSTLTECRNMYGLASNPVNDDLYMLCSDNTGYRRGHLFVIDTTTNAVLSDTVRSVTNYAYRNNSSINDMAVSSDGTRVYFYVPGYSFHSKLDVFDGTTGAYIQTINGPYPGSHYSLQGDIVVTPDGTKVFAADYGYGPQYFNLTSSSSGFMSPTDRWYSTVAISLDGTKVYTVHGSKVVVNDTSTYSYLGSITGSFSSAGQIAITPGNDGSGDFHKIVVDSAMNNASSVYAADMDNDGREDIIAAAALSNEVAVYHNNGDSTFTKSIVTSTYDHAATVRAADIDGDGWNDLVTSSSSGDVSWWKNNQDGTYTRHSIASIYANDLEVTDFDHDGYLDIAGFDNSGSRVLWWRNDGAGSFTQYVVDTGFQAPQGFAVGDLSGDTFDDMVGVGNSTDLNMTQLYWWPSSGAGYTVTPTSGLVTSETGTTATFTMVLDTKPSSNVVIHLTSSDTTEGTVSPYTMTFTPLNWNQPQTATVTGVDDNLADGSIAYTIITSVTTNSDVVYRYINPDDVSVINADDDNTRSGGPYAYIANTGDNTVSVIDTTTHSVVATTPVGPSPWGVAVNPNGNYTYVTNNDGTITVIDAINNTPATTSSITGSLADVTFNPTGTSAYIAAGSEVSVVDASSHNATTGVATTPNPLGGAATTLTTGVGMDPGGNYVYAVSTQGLYITTIATATNSVVDSTVLSSNASSNTYDVAIGPSGTYAYVPDYGLNVVYVYNTGSHALVSTIPVGSHPMGIVADPAADYVYVANQGGNSVSVIDTTSNTVVKTVTVGNSPEGISITPTGDEVYVVNHGENDVSVISTATNTVTVTIPVGSSPTSIGEFISPTPPIKVTPVQGLTTTESGGSDTFTIVLTRQPTADVTIGLSSSDTTEGTVSPSSVTFTTSNWSTPQTVTVTGVDDSINDGNVDYTIVTAPAFSLDRAFDGIDPPDVAVTNGDNEPVAFNAVESQSGSAPAADKDALAGKIHTKVIGQAFNLDIVALADTNGDGTVDGVATGYPSSVDHTVKLEVVSGTGSCSSLAVVETLPSAVFAVADQPTEQGRKQVSLTINHVGQNLRLRMTDDGGTPDTSDDLVGCSTDTFTVRPVSYSLKVSQADWENPGDTALNNGSTSGALIHKAGRPLRVTVEALDGNGNAVTGFANYTVKLVETRGDTSMATGNHFYAGGVTPGEVTFDGSGSGIAVDDTATYREVGWLYLNIDPDKGYAESGGDGAGNDGSTDTEMQIQSPGQVTVGRFVPDHFAVTVDNAGSFAPACGNTYTYVGQGFGLQSSPKLTVTAKNYQGDTVVNYQGGFWKLGTLASLQYEHLSPAITGTSLAANGTPTYHWATASGTNGADTVTFDTAPLVYTHGATTVSPFTPAIDMTFTLQDSDQITCASCNGSGQFKLSDVNTTGIPGPQELRYGRLAFTPDPTDNYAEGPETAPITKDVEAEYYNGANWVVNSSDTCTAITAANYDLKSDVDDPALGTATVNVGASGNSTLSIADSPLTGAATTLTFSAPGTLNTGTVDFILNLAAPANDLSWLRYDWDGNNSLDNLQGRVRFGPYDNKRWMYMREPW